MGVFFEEVCKKLAFYVYRLENPSTNRTFYVGKGQGQRVFTHAKLALRGEVGLRHDLIRALREKGLEPRIVIHRHGLDEATALEVEAALIDAYSVHDLSNDIRGHDTDRGMMEPDDLADLYGAPPAEIAVPAILIKIERQWHKSLSPEQLYERTRRYWKCNPERMSVPPKYALSIARGLVREVYQIERWETYRDMSKEIFDQTRLPQERSERDRSGQSRRGFIGCIADDQQLRSSLVGKSTRHVSFGSQSPFVYLNCRK